MKGVSRWRGGLGFRAAKGRVVPTSLAAISLSCSSPSLRIACSSRMFCCCSPAMSLKSTSFALITSCGVTAVTADPGGVAPGEAPKPAGEGEVPKVGVRWGSLRGVVVALASPRRAHSAKTLCSCRW